jgi:ABC-2 type transport system permease protein
LVIVWSGILVVIIYLIGLVVGAAINIPNASSQVFLESTKTLVITAVLTITLASPIAFVASAGHGYLAPMGFAVFAVIMAQVIAAAGWGEYFPWSVPALYAGMAGSVYGNLGVLSFVIVLITGLAGMLGTLAWWIYADQTY